MKPRSQNGIGVGRNNQAVTLNGMVHSLRSMGALTFLTLRTRRAWCSASVPGRRAWTASPTSAPYRVSGTVREEPRAPGGFELSGAQVEVLSRPAAPLPVPISKRRLALNLDTELGLRPVVLRSLRARSVFRIQDAVGRAFREYMHREGFTEIHTPKIVHAGAEGGSNIFRLDYFGKKAFLAQSPQFYKQTMVGAFERVFEVAPVFRAEKHATPRHLERVHLPDFEMGFYSTALPT